MSKLQAFQSLARVYIADENLTVLESTIHQIASQLHFHYE
ncbi:hypothetical protein EDD57_11719 [Baia soyae]|uniref:Uncharacterized protein n=1 Tax=Baia soyae TaxID=1544746 RepID=A0A4R2RVA7_9BACL|nr:hypothetical protein EDD57_11719 [Baia soyae]